MATIKGKWKWNATIKDYYHPSTTLEIPFTSNGKQFTKIKFELGITGGLNVYYDFTQVQYVNPFYNEETQEYDNEIDFDESYRIIDYGEIEQQISDEWYVFITQNSTLIAPPTMAEKLMIIAENQQKVFDAGKQAEYDAFWDAVQESGKRTSYVYAFSRWGSEYIRPKYKVVLTDKGSQKHIFYMNGYIKKIEADYFDFSQLPRGTNDNQAFSLSFTACSKLEEIEDIGLPISYSYESAFAWCYALKKIAKITVDANTILSNAFLWCSNLEDITFEGEIGNDINFKWSTKLTNASIESIINHLSSAVSGKTLTLSKAAVDEAFKWYFDSGDPDTSLWVPGSDESNPHWPGLRDSKPNWTITLV